jgi:hypothetical protein
MKGMCLIPARNKSYKITLYCKLLKAPEMVLSKVQRKEKKKECQCSSYINMRCPFAASSPCPRGYGG